MFQEVFSKSITPKTDLAHLFPVEPCSKRTQSSPQMADCPVTSASIPFFVLHIGLFSRLTAAPVPAGVDLQPIVPANPRCQPHYSA
ncbi:uncharacterized protein TRIVIDRAFT_217004 [Trichoderma virens Gv29-8]|uniref:Uncharacterized protein n=1 Tax=Hypocrea virens (strain Gv29-8 / FGSC 10586) TaxID=413071 RepID=G9N9C1_HYPVG|nr:uncharacterized protein TRIVIDRAFT_217004 [Trichoderma virens Gv29-8]EHK16542.1 hypothetical protein TRIVIDRAFT_217004 [Trichoderma virens Gv29-8]